VCFRKEGTKLKGLKEMMVYGESLGKFGCVSFAT